MISGSGTMANVWSELATDGAWDPWVLGQLFATLAGWDNNEAVAINARTINDPDAFAAAWRNHGGGGAGVWEAADGSEIAAAPDDGWRFSKPFEATEASFSGAVTAAHVSAGTVDVAGALTAGTAEIDGGLTAGTAEIVGALDAGSITAGTGSFSGLVTASAGLSATTGTFSGVLAANGGLTATTGTFSGLLTANAGITALGLGGSNDQGVVLKHNVSAGQVSIGASNAADPLMIFKDHSGDEVMRLAPSASAYAMDVNLVAPRSTSAARFTAGMLVQTTAAAKVFEVVGATVGFYGATPVSQPTLPAAAGATYTATEQTLLNAIRTLLRNVGLSA